jgi:hypothetical protein
VSVAETCTHADGTTSARTREVKTTVNPSAMYTRQPVTTTIDLADFDLGTVIAATGTVDVVFPLPAEIASVTSVQVTPSPVSDRWTAAVVDRTVRLSYRHPTKSPARFAGTPALVIVGVTRATRPNQVVRWLAYSSYETVLNEQGMGPHDRCVPDDPGQVLGSFSLSYPPI